MEILKRSLVQIRNQLAGLTASQKMLIGLLVVVMLGTIFFTIQLSAKPDMVELLPAQGLSPEELTTIKQHLQGKYQYQITGDKILVPTDQLFVIQGELAAAQALPKDTTAAFAKLAEANAMFNSSEHNERLWNYAKQEVLAKVIRNFPYVADATVLISKGERVSFGAPAVPSSATVSVKAKYNESLTSAQVLSIVETVRGAVSGLKREDVHVTDGTRAYVAPSEDVPMPTDLLAYKKSIEDDLTRKLLQYLAYIGDVKIAVNAVPDMSARNINTETYDPKGVVKSAVEETSRDTSTSDGPVNGGQPGVQPNSTLVLNNTSSSGMRSSSSSNDAVTKTDVRFGKKVEAQMLAPGTELKDLTCSISVPRSYFVSIYRRNKKDPKADPDDNDPDLIKLISASSKDVQAQAMNAIGVKIPEQVRVSWFDDAVGPQSPLGGNSTVAVASSG